MLNQYIKIPLLVKANDKKVSYQCISADEVGWKHLNFESRMLQQHETWEGNTGQNEMLFVLLGGNFSAQTDQGFWETKNGRKDVFSGLPHALYLPPNTNYSIKASSQVLDLACGWCPAEEIHPVQFITPEKVDEMGIEFRGGDNASRQINSILPPGSDCQRLVSVEVYTPSGNWSSFPAHKHDEVKIDPETGAVKEASLEEIYFYKVDQPQGYAMQKVYTDDRSLNQITESHNNDAVLVPRGYHPVVALHGYNVYYLNFLAGSHQSLANTDDPDHKWIYGTWKGMDERIPMVTLDMNSGEK
ncbi:5-deoxy-glucuronate isomerase [Roseimarinus sediminis]|uniref:5-deoxy-glucuronate isomerase n=1 Tax=Roseimarinus sediminis TaxID=1610899 RepID=UPI003D19C313